MSAGDSKAPEPSFFNRIFNDLAEDGSGEDHAGKADEPFDSEGNFKPDLPPSMSTTYDEEGNPTLVATPKALGESREDYFAKKEGKEPRVSPLVIPGAPAVLSPEAWPEDYGLEPGTTTEEEFLESELESELIAEERRSKQKLRRGSSKEEFIGRRKQGWLRDFICGVGSTKSLLWAFLRWPLLLVFCSFIVLDLIIYISVRQWVRWYEWAIVWRGQKRILREKLTAAKNYEDYKHAARTLDDYFENDEWKKDEYSPHYDVDLVYRTVRRLRRYRSAIASATQTLNKGGKKDNDSNHAQTRVNATKDIQKILQHGACKSNFAGVENEALYSYTYLGTKSLVEEYISEMCLSLEAVATSPDLKLDERRDFIRKMSKSYGRTALCLSGGATLGYYHSVVKALFEKNLLPKIITGTSAGSLIAAMVCCSTDEELVKEILVPSIQEILTACEITYWERFKRLYRTGAMFDHREWFQKTMLATKGPLTFLEAYQRTGRILNVPIVPDEPHSPFKLCNYITTPHVVVATAVIASSAVPGVLNPIELLMKTETGELVPFHGSGRRWRDGSLMMDIPERELHRLFNVNFSIVSQVNPHIVLFFFDRRGSAGSPTAHRHGQGWRGGFVASALVHHFKLDLQKWLALLKDFELLPRVLGTDVSDVFLQRFEGSVTIVPKPTLADYRLILTDPTNERMVWYIERGQGRTWAKIHMIENRMKIEQTLCRLRRLLGGGDEKGSRRRFSNMSSASGLNSARSPRWFNGLDDMKEEPNGDKDEKKDLETK